MIAHPFPIEIPSPLSINGYPHIITEKDFMKKLIAATLFTLVSASPAFAQEDNSHTTTTIQRDGAGGYNVSTTHQKVQSYDSTGHLLNTSDPADTGSTPNTTKRVERDYMDDNGNQTKSITDHTTDPYGNNVTTHYEEKSATTNQ